MRRKTGWILAGIALALVSTGGWWAHRADRAPATQAARPGPMSPVPGAPATAPARDRPSAPMQAAGLSAGPIDAARARCEEAARQVVRRRAAELAALPDADSQLTAALLDTEPTPDTGAMEAATMRRHRAVAWAMQLAPEDPLVVAHAHRLCSRDDRCDASRALDRLVRADPDNTWTWVAVLARAQAKGDAAGGERALERAARSGAARSRLGQTALRLLEQFGEPELPGRCVTQLAEGVLPGRPPTNVSWIDIVIGAKALQTLPVVQPLLVACPRELRDRRRRALCIRSLAHVASGETLFEQRVATFRLVELTAGAAKGAAWRERYRNLQWLSAQAVERNLFDRAPLESWERGEVRALEEQLQAVDAWPAPPGWLPDGAEARSLVLTGRRPAAR